MIEICRAITIQEEEVGEDNDEDKLELNYPNKDDSLSEQLYDRHGIPYISKK